LPRAPGCGTENSGDPEERISFCAGAGVREAKRRVDREPERFLPPQPYWPVVVEQQDVRPPWTVAAHTHHGIRYTREGALERAEEVLDRLGRLPTGQAEAAWQPPSRWGRYPGP